MSFNKTEHLILKERARKLAQPPKLSSEAKDALEIVIFSLANENYAIEMKDIKAVQPFHGATFLPGLPPVIKGVINFSGQIYAVFDLKKIFSLQIENANQQHLLIVEHPILKICFLIDEVQDFRFVSPRAIQTQVTSLTNETRSHIRGILNDSTILLDLESVINDKTLFNLT